MLSSCDAYNGRMPSLPIKRATRALSAAIVTVLLVIAGLVSGSGLAQAAQSASVSVTTSSISAGPGESLAVTVTVTNTSSVALPEAEAIITAPSAALSTVKDLDAWFAADDKDTQPGRFLATIDIPEVAAGKSVDISAELPL
ncbi:MAG: hypothetical protein RL683_1061, partial [Actinomycetota bacterium]